MGICMTYGRFPMESLTRARSDGAYARQLLDEGMDDALDHVFSLWKGWDAIHYVISSERRAAGKILEDSSDPLSRAVYGSQVLHRSAEGGYGPARYSTYAQVREIHQALSGVTREVAEAVFDPKVMAEQDVYRIYPEFEELWETLQEFQRFHRTASEQGEGILVDCS